MREIVTLAVSIATSIGALHGIQVSDADEYPVPPAARMLLNNVKVDVRELAVRVMRKQPASAPIAAASAETTLHDVLAAAGALESCEGAYAALEAPKVSAPAGDLIAVVTTLNIPCGDDVSLLLFRHDADGWKLVYDRTRSDYEEITGAAENLQYSVSPPDAGGARLVLAVDINPHCQSNWQEVRWDVARIDPGTTSAEPIAQGKDGIFVMDEPKLSVTPTTFGVEYAGSSIDTVRLTRSYHRYYRVTAAGGTERIEPIALDPREYVEEWLLTNDAHDNFGGEWEDVGRCRDGTWQVPFTKDETTKYYFVAEEKGVYRMVSVGEEPSEGCEAEP